MSTAANIIIEYGDSKLVVYRHWDGYPGCTGHHIGAVLRDFIKVKRAAEGIEYTQAVWGMVNEFARELLNSADERGRHDYELMDVQTHGIDHLYHVIFNTAYNNHSGGNSRPPFTIRHVARPRGSQDNTWLRGGAFLTLELFAKVVNDDVAAINHRIRLAKKENPGNKYYQSAEELEPLAL